MVNTNVKNIIELRVSNSGVKTGWIAQPLLTHTPLLLFYLHLL